MVGDSAARKPSRPAPPDPSLPSAVVAAVDASPGSVPAVAGVAPAAAPNDSLVLRTALAGPPARGDGPATPPAPEGG